MTTPRSSPWGPKCASLHLPGSYCEVVPPAFTAHYSRRVQTPIRDRRALRTQAHVRLHVVSSYDTYMQCIPSSPLRRDFQGFEILISSAGSTVEPADGSIVVVLALAVYPARQTLEELDSKHRCAG